MKAVITHDPSKSQLQTWIYNTVSYYLSDWIKGEIKRYNKVNFISINLFPKEIKEIAESKYRCKDLSSDATIVAKIAMNSAIFGKTRLTNREELVVAMLRQAGWSAQRIYDSIEEIREYLA